MKNNVVELVPKSKLKTYQGEFIKIEGLPLSIQVAQVNDKYVAMVKCVVCDGYGLPNGDQKYPDEVNDITRVGSVSFFDREASHPVHKECTENIKLWTLKDLKARQLSGTDEQCCMFLEAR